MFERGATCNSHGECFMEPPTQMAQEQRDSLVRKLGLGWLSKIAIVGSSGSLRHGGHGTDIDSHDIVVRINGAPTRAAYGAWVGEKTHVAFAAPGGIRHVRYPKPLQAVVFQHFHICASKEARRKAADWARHQLPPDTITVRAGRARRAGSGLHRFWDSELHEDEPSDVWIVDPDWGCALWRDELDRADSYFPSTGMNAVGFFATLAKSLGAPPPSVYGFGGHSPCEKYYDCYSKGIDYESNNWHPFNAEHHALRAWNESGHIALHM